MTEPRRVIIDLRDSQAYARDRPAGAVHLRPEELECTYLMPPRPCEIVLVGLAAADLAPYIEALRQSGRPVVAHHAGDTWRHHLPAETGPPTRTRLWEPAAVVVRAIESYGDRLPGPRALDLACGSGRDSVYLALAGMEVTAVDILPDALEQARDLAARHGVSIRTLLRDLEAPGALADRSADLIVVVRYLERSLFGAITAALSPGGILAYETFTEPLAPSARVRNPRFVLRAGELRTAFPELEVLEHGVGVSGTARVARLVARRPAGGFHPG